MIIVECMGPHGTFTSVLKLAREFYPGRTRSWEWLEGGALG